MPRLTRGFSGTGSSVTVSQSALLLERGAAMVATVTGLDGALAGKPFRVGTRPITFGRGDENDVVINSLLVSRVHAELRPEGGGYVLQDRGSSNGTWVNGSQVTAQQLRPGDEVVIGGETFRFETSDVQSDVQAGLRATRAQGAA